jgi:tetratricopeptide (TPR) repeat protein
MKNILFAIFIVIVGCYLISCGDNLSNYTDAQKDTSITILSKFIEKYPEEADNYYKRSLLFINQKKANEALKDIEKAIALDSTKATYYLVLCDVNIMQIQTRKSKIALEKCLQLDPKNVEAHLKMAELYLYVGQNKTSIEHIDKALQINKYNAKAYFLKGMNFKEMRDTINSLSSFQTCVEQDPEYFRAYVELGSLESDRKNPIALSYYQTALKLNPKSLEVYYAIGMHFQNNNEIDKAMESYQTILQLDSTYKNALYNLGYIYLNEKEEINKAQYYFNKAILADDNYAEAYYMRGLCYEALKNNKLAEQDYNQALKHKEDFELAYEGLQRLKK